MEFLALFFTQTKIVVTLLSITYANRQSRIEIVYVINHHICSLMSKTLRSIALLEILMLRICDCHNYIKTPCPIGLPVFKLHVECSPEFGVRTIVFTCLSNSFSNQPEQSGMNLLLARWLSASMLDYFILLEALYFLVAHHCHIMNGTHLIL